MKIELPTILKRAIEDMLSNDVMRFTGLGSTYLIYLEILCKSFTDNDFAFGLRFDLKYLENVL